MANKKKPSKTEETLTYSGERERGRDRRVKNEPDSCDEACGEGII